MAKPFAPKAPELPAFAKGTPKPLKPKTDKKGGKKAPKPGCY